MKIKELKDFQIEKIESNYANGILYKFTHVSGFVLNYIPKRKFSKKFAGILVPLGSVYNKISDNEKQIDLPAGSAHYMEHCVFSKDENRGLLETLSALGANANAYTSNTHTMYYFTAIENFFEALELYLKSVLNPYIEDDRVEAERNIIIQELEMYDDDPDSKSYRKLLESLFKTHPIRYDIGGTKKSVSEITSQHLKICKNYFYDLSNISVTLSGDIKDENIEEFLKKLNFSDSNKNCNYNLEFPLEDEGVLVTESTVEMDVDVSSFIVGFKNPNVNINKQLSGPEHIMEQKGGQLFLEVLLGESSDIYEELYSKGLINDSFGFQYVCEKNYSYFIMGSESPDPVVASKKLTEMLIEKINDGINESEFNIQKKAALGNFMRSLDSVEHCGLSSAIASSEGTNIFTYPGLYDELNCDKIRKKLEFISDKKNKSSVFVTKGE